MGALFVVEASRQLSDAIGVPGETPVATHCSGSVFTVILDGQVSAGGTLSMTVTEKLQVVEFPDVSVTRNVFVVDPAGNGLPDAMPERRVKVAPGQLSLNVTL